MESSADRWVIWDKPNARYFNEYKDAPRLFTRRLDAVRELRRHIKDHNWRVSYDMSRGVTESEWFIPFRQLSEEDDFEILPCKVTFAVEREEV